MKLQVEQSLPPLLNPGSHFRSLPLSSFHLSRITQDRNTHTHVACRKYKATNGRGAETGASSFQEIPSTWKPSELFTSFSKVDVPDSLFFLLLLQLVSESFSTLSCLCPTPPLNPLQRWFSTRPERCCCSSPFFAPLLMSMFFPSSSLLLFPPPFY